MTVGINSARPDSRAEKKKVGVGVGGTTYLKLGANEIGKRMLYHGFVASNAPGWAQPTFRFSHIEKNKITIKLPVRPTPAPFLRFTRNRS